MRIKKRFHHIRTFLIVSEVDVPNRMEVWIQFRVKVILDEEVEKRLAAH
ncbi:tRNA modification GTPase [Bacillus sp. SG-1]|nr:tRNA modification GTPase [Bacillus sp. SG-1]